MEQEKEKEKQSFLKMVRILHKGVQIIPGTVPEKIRND